MAKILVVDDNPTNRIFLVTLLGYGGHILLEATDGVEALTAVAAERPDLIITDILMPTMDGYELVRRLRSTPEVAGTPVIFCTAHYHERDAKDLARECGVSLVLTKPCEPETVLQAVNDCLGAASTVVPAPVAVEFDREHLRLLTDKLSLQTNELTATNHRLQALLDVNLPLASETDPGRLLDKFCSAARDLIAARCSLAAIPLPDRSAFTHLAFAGNEKIPDKTLFAPGHKLFSGVMESRRTMRLPNPGGNPEAFGLPPSFMRFESLLVAPIVSPTYSYGWLCLFHRLGAAEFSEEDARFAEILSGLVGRVYENGKLYERERQYATVLRSEIADRKKAQEKSAQLADIVQFSDDAILGMTLDGTILSWNRGAERIFGCSSDEMQGKPASPLFEPKRAGELHAALLALQQGRSVDRYESVGITSAGPVEIAVTVSPILKADGGLSGASAIIRDITTQKKLHRQLLVAQKMEAVGRLSAGVAHDFNNLLMVISGYSDLLLRKRSKDDPDYASILEIQKATEQAVSVTRQLLTFSRRQITQPGTFNLNKVVAEVERMLGRVLGEDIELVSLPDPALGSVEADAGQLEQVILNLVVNARDAMPEGGKLTLQTANMELYESLAMPKADLAPGAYVALVVTDTGIGMDAITRDRIFEPFFTTKEAGRGTGLGLSTVYSIVEQCRGAISVYSEPGLGTTFKIFFPRVSESAPVTLAAAVTPAPRGSETILVVEDEDGVRSLLLSILTGEGYNVLQASNGGEALLLCERNENISLMISDITMPGMTGIELVRRLKPARPEMKIVLMSGYAEGAVLREGTLIPDVALLEKPFPPGVIVRKVREILDGSLPGYKAVEMAIPELQGKLMGKVAGGA